MTVAMVAGALVLPRHAGATTPLTTYNFGISSFTEDAANGLIYGTVPGSNQVVVINPVTQLVIKTLTVGSSPSSVCVSADGSTVYVANEGATTLSVINATTNVVSSTINLGAGNTPQSVQTGTNGRLWVYTPSQIQQFDTSGNSAGPALASNANTGFVLYSGGKIVTANGGSTLYFAGTSTSPSYLYKWDVSGTTGVGELGIASGGNGIDLAVSPNGNLVVDTQGGGNNGTPSPGQIAVYNSADFSIKESLSLIGSPAIFAFSPDSLYGYASGNLASDVQFFNLTTGVETSSVGITSDAQQLFVDNSGKYLWAETNNGTTEVFSTGRVAVPEPASAGMVLLAAGMLGRRKRR